MNGLVGRTMKDDAMKVLLGLVGRTMNGSMGFPSGGCDGLVR
jgi:hypothetical protein